ncbi:hypothetical protein ACFLZN_02390 [Nanoarchaeota archaeon]
MTKTVVLLEKKGYLITLLSLLKQKESLKIKDLKRKIPSSTYYYSILNKVHEINNHLDENQCEPFIQTTLVKEGKKLLSGIKLNPQVSTKLNEKFIVLNFQNGIESRN